jgi:hypothetical protein
LNNGGVLRRKEVLRAAKQVARFYNQEFLDVPEKNELGEAIWTPYTVTVSIFLLVLTNGTRRLQCAFRGHASLSARTTSNMRSLPEQVHGLRHPLEMSCTFCSRAPVFSHVCTVWVVGYTHGPCHQRWQSHQRSKEPRPHIVISFRF